VETGAETPTAIQVLSGVEDKDLILKEPPGDLKDGQDIRVQTETWAVRP
jgi:hypothetical protein